MLTKPDYPLAALLDPTLIRLGDDMPPRHAQNALRPAPSKRSVMPGLDPGIQARKGRLRSGGAMDRRVEPGDDEQRAATVHPALAAGKQ